MRGKRQPLGSARVSARRSGTILTPGRRRETWGRDQLRVGRQMEDQRLQVCQWLWGGLLSCLLSLLLLLLVVVVVVVVVVSLPL